jgi:putative heme-binding domain-containing protein
LIGSAGGPAELARLFERVSTGELRGDAPLRALRALADAARLRNVRPTSDLKEIAAFFHQKDPALTAEALRIAGLWKVKAAAPLLAQFAQSAEPAIRSGAIEGLRELGGGEAISALSELSTDRNPAEVRRLAVGALAALDLQGSLARIAEVLTAQSTEADALETWRAILIAKTAPDTLASALPRNLPKPVAAAGLRAARELGKKGEKLAMALSPLAGANIGRANDYQALAALAKRDGDPARGEEIYRRTALACVTCHAIGGAGGKVGPELTSMGASAPLDYIIESLLDPAAKVKEGFNAVTLTLKDGTVASGIQARETAQEIFLRNAVGAEQAVPKASITARENIGSIMPAGMVEQLKDRERLDLYAFLAQLGKPGVYDASKGNVARVWWLSDDHSGNPGIRESGNLGVPVFTSVDGRLPRERLLESLQLVPNAGETPFALTRFQLPAAGKVKFNLTGISKAYLDGEPLAVASEPSPSAELAAGEHTLAVKLDAKALPETLRAAADGVRFLTE